MYSFLFLFLKRSKTFFLFLSQFFLLCLCFLPTQAEAKKKQPVPVVEEIRLLKKELHSLTDRLAKVVDRVGEVKSPGIPKKTDPTNYMVQHLEMFSKYLKRRLQIFITGIVSLGKISSTPFAFGSNMVGKYVASLIFSGAIGVGCLLFLHWILKGPLQALVKRVHRDVVTRLLLATAYIFLPTVFSFAVSLLLAELLKSFHLPVQKGLGVPLGAFIPFHMSLIWGAFFWIRLVFTPSRAAYAIISLPPYVAMGAAQRLKVVIFLYIMGAIFLTFFDLSALDHALIHSLWDAFFLMVSFFVLSSISYIRSHLNLGEPQTKRLMAFLGRVRVFICFFICLWFFGKSLILSILMPALLSFLSVFAFFLLGYEARRCYLRFLWVYRKRLPQSLGLLRQKVWIARIFSYGVWGALGGIWAPYFWFGEDLQGVLVKGSSAFFTSSFVGRSFNAFLVFMGAFFLTKGLERLLKYYVEEKYSSVADPLENNFLASRLKTLMAMLKTVLRIVIWVPAAAMMFAQFGETINFVPWISSLGFASLGLTFGVQNIVRDFVTGFFIILENNLVVGDEVEIDGKSGKVESISLRTLKIRTDVGMLLTIPFGGISVIGNKNRDFSATVMNISVSYNADLDQVQALLEKAFSLTRRVPFFNRRILGPMESRGITEVTNYSVVLQVKIKTTPNAHDAIRRAFTKNLKILFDENGIVVPTPPHSVHRSFPSLTQTIT